MFCPKCGSLMLPGKEKKGMACSSCGFSDKKNNSEMKISERGNKNKDIEIIDDKEKDMLPKLKATCSKCLNGEAYYWHIQTRAADEPETRFNKCTKCGHTWRTYG